MAKPMRIEISFNPADYPNQAAVSIPSDENYREILLGAQVGDDIRFRQGDKDFFGTVKSRGFASRTPSDPEDSDWMFRIFLK